MRNRVRADGKFFSLNGARFPFRGVTYGTFEPRASDNARFPHLDRMKQDFADIHANGFTVVRTYTEPPPDMVALAADWELHLLAGVFFPDWRYLVGASRRQSRRIAADGRRVVREAARRLASEETVLALCIGNEVPADVLRWLGAEVVAASIAEYASVVREEDAEALVTYANYPTAEYLELDALDFLTFNVFLERQADLRRYLTRLHHLAGDRPLVLGEIGLDAGGTAPEGEDRQAEALEWQLQTIAERGVAGACVFSWTDEWWVGDSPVEGWRFGLTRDDRSPRPALEVARRWNERTVRDLPYDWPQLSVVICAYNAGATLDECLRHTCALDYPNLDIVVVDDGSTDDTADIARSHPRARLVSITHAGLSVARNAGWVAARADMVAYLDSDAYPTPEWPWFLALGLDDQVLGGVGGPNVPPASDSRSAQQVARAPGGPLHVLVADDRAEHVPGCNMAFRKAVLAEVGGFDPVYTSAGDDVDACWRILDRGWQIGFHPAALVWHHRRAGLRPYLRQQHGYGRSEALVAARHPDRFTPTGSARWRGRIYESFPMSLRHQPIYRGLYGTAAYQSVYRSGGYALDLAHQVGIPLAAMALVTAPLALLSPWLALPAILALTAVVVLVVIDMARVSPPRTHPGVQLSFRAGVAVMHVLQPFVRNWGRLRSRELARRDLPKRAGIVGPVDDAGGGILLVPDTGSRAGLVAAIIDNLRGTGLRILPATGWEAHDARIVGSRLLFGDLVTSAHPIGSVQIRVKRRLRWGFLGMLAASMTAVALVDTALAAAVAAGGIIDLVIGVWRTGPLVRRTVRSCAPGLVA